MSALTLDSTAWLALSLGLVALSTTAVLVVALPAVVELGRAARSAEKLFDTLNRELPPVLEAMRATGEELSELTDGVGEGVERAGQLVQQVDEGVTFVKRQAGQVRKTSGSVFAGVQAAWRVFRASSAAPAPYPKSPQTQPRHAANIAATPSDAAPSAAPAKHIEPSAPPPSTVSDRP